MRAVKRQISDSLIHDIEDSATMEQLANSTLREREELWFLVAIIDNIEEHLPHHKFRELTPSRLKKVEGEIKMLLHAERDRMRNIELDTINIFGFDINGPYYCEAFGIIRALKVIGYGALGAVNLAPAQPPNLMAWFYKLCDEVLEEEGLFTNNKCAHCMERYCKDDHSVNERKFKLSGV